MEQPGGQQNITNEMMQPVGWAGLEVEVHSIQQHDAPWN
jgi:hypothetical protein